MDNTKRAWSARNSEATLSIVSDWTLWVIAAAPALAIGIALSRHAVHPALVIVVALAVELAGVFAGHALTEAREYNVGLDRKDQRRLWPLGLALAVYVGVGVVLSVILDVWPDNWPDIDKGWPILMPVLAVIVYWVNGERVIIRHLIAARVQPVQPAPATQDDRLTAILDGLDSINRAVTDLSNRVADVEGQPAKSEPQPVNGADKAAALVWLSGHPDATEDMLVQAFNVSPRTARRYLAEFRTTQPVSANGNGGTH